MQSPVSRTQWLSYTALFLALSVLLPIGFHTMGVAGRVFLPMHLPVLLAGFLIGPAAGLVVGILSPGLSHLITGMPPTYAVPLMSLELPIYGLIAGLAYYRLRINIYISLLIAMLLGRLMFGLGLFVLGMFMELPYTAATFFSAGGAIGAGLPGVALQLVLVPVLVAAINRKRR